MTSNGVSRIPDQGTQRCTIASRVKIVLVDGVAPRTNAQGGRLLSTVAPATVLRLLVLAVCKLVVATPSF